MLALVHPHSVCEGICTVCFHMQAAAYQVSMQTSANQQPAPVTTLLTDFERDVLPNERAAVLRGHRGNVKCVQFVGPQVLATRPICCSTEPGMRSTGAEGNPNPPLSVNTRFSVPPTALQPLCILPFQPPATAFRLNTNRCQVTS